MPLLLKNSPSVPIDDALKVHVKQRTWESLRVEGPRRAIFTFGEDLLKESKLCLPRAPASKTATWECEEEPPRQFLSASVCKHLCILSGLGSRGHSHPYF